MNPIPDGNFIVLNLILQADMVIAVADAHQLTEVDNVAGYFTELVRHTL